LRLTTSGLRVAYQVWGEGNPIKVLCLHGWLDNSNSFNVLAPFLSRLIILDLGSLIISHNRTYLCVMWAK
jgi:pimeloyl-ACP methyl ester carboxylesterase